MNPRLTHDRLLSLLDYDPATGVFRWRVARSNRRRGSLAGCTEQSGYLRIRIEGRQYRAQRLAWFYVYGRWPSEPDHINRIKSDNRIANFREVTRAQNNVNAPAQRRSRTKIRGVHFAKHAGRYRAQVVANGKTISLGYFDTTEKASAAYRAAVQQFHGVSVP